jgi:predicted DCC family thiol-disulfide oxidoreductase YuxK
MSAQSDIEALHGSTAERFNASAALTNPRDKDVVFFDGDCLFCQKRVRWLIKRDRDRALHFAPLQGKLAEEALAGTVLTASLSTMALVTRCLTPAQEIFIKSSAAVQIAARLPFPWRLAACFVIIPRRWRDAAYDFIARHRHRWSSAKSTSCALPDEAHSARFFS